MIFKLYVFLSQDALSVTALLLLVGSNRQRLRSENQRLNQNIVALTSDVELYRTRSGEVQCFLLHRVLLLFHACHNSFYLCKDQSQPLLCRLLDICSAG